MPIISLKKNACRFYNNLTYLIVRSLQIHTIFLTSSVCGSSFMSNNMQKKNGV